MTKTIQLELKANDYTKHVLLAVRKKYGLRTNGEAVDKLMELFGGEFVEPELRPK